MNHGSRLLLLAVLLGCAAAASLCGLGLWQLWRERRAAASELVRARTAVVGRAAEALAGEIQRCEAALPSEEADALERAACDGAQEGGSPFHWFVLPQALEPPPLTGPLETFRTEVSQRLASGACADPRSEVGACLELAGDLASAAPAADPVVAYFGLEVLRALESAQARADRLSRLRSRLERIVFADVLGSHPEAGASGRWERLGRYRVVRLPSPIRPRVAGFDGQPRAFDLASFLASRGFVEEPAYSYAVVAPAAAESRRDPSTSVAFVDEKAGFLSLTDTDFAHRLALAHRATDRLLAWLLAGALVLVGSLALTFRAARLAHENVRSRENFVAAVSHEFRSPLGGLRLMLETLLSGRVSAEAQRLEYLEQMQHEVSRLSRLSENLLSLGRLRRDHRRRLESVAPGDIVAPVLERLRSDARARSVRVTSTLADELPTWRGDPDLLQLALLNLVENAIEYSPTGGEVLVEVSVREQGLCISVRDHGPGISREEQRRIFDWFYRVGDELVRESPGTGLGLAIVREVAARHRGRVRVVSAPGAGATFELLLPAEVS